jgi:hypothetical protein
MSFQVEECMNPLCSGIVCYASPLIMQCIYARLLLYRFPRDDEVHRRKQLQRETHQFQAKNHWNPARTLV